MLQALKSTLRRLLPCSLLGAYHFFASFAAAAAYGFPARKLVVVGLTGTKGKSTTSAMLRHMLQDAGYRTGLISTAEVAMGERSWVNDLKMTMPGRATLQRYFRAMVQSGCTHAVVETSSEGLAQFRHLGIPYRVAVFTNLAPEHLESHGSFSAYRTAKGRLFAVTARRGGTTVANLDDAEASYFLSFPAPHRVGYTLANVQSELATETVVGTASQVSALGLELAVGSTKAHLPVGGTFNAANALAAVTAAYALGVPIEAGLRALTSYPGTPGRLEFIRAGQQFNVVVDYAHTSGSLEALYLALATEGSLIAVLGSCGGGRDKAKRPVLGRLAGRYARTVIVTNEDPYNEDPAAIMGAVAAGVRTVGKQEGVDLFVVPERREAIRRALTLAQPGETVAITGKGSEQWLCEAGGSMVPWDDRQVVREELGVLGYR